MRSASKRGRRSRPSSLALEEQQEAPVPMKRTRSAHSSPAVAQPTRPTQSYQVRRQDHNSRPQSSSGGHSSRNSHTNDSSNHKEPSPIPEVPFDDDLPPQMPRDSKATARVETAKRRGSRDSKRAAVPAPLSKLPDLIDDPHVSDMSSLSELDSEAETERLVESPRKGAPGSVISYIQPASKPMPQKVPMEPKQNKSPDVDMTPDEGESQPAKKRKRENNDVAQKDVKLEEKTSRPVTPFASKILVPLDKNKKSKTADPIQEKHGVTPMEGIEAASSPAIVNGDANPAQEDPPEPEPEVVFENFAEIEVEDEQKDQPSQDVDPDVDEDTAEGAEVSREDEEDAERLQKRKAAADALTQIELEFARLRDKLYEERISDIDEEIRLVNEGTHPELVAMMEAVNKRRDDKIRLYNTQLRYALHSQHTTMIATRSQLHSQYAQHVREIRERYLDRVSEGLYQIQRERRAADMLVQDYTYRISEDRATRMRERQAYNMEVQILSGIAKYIGFPAAPEVKGVASSELQQDLEAMGIAVSRVSLRGTGASRGIDDHQEQVQRHPWGNRTAPPSPPPNVSQTHHHHHHHNHQHSHHHHMSHQEPPVSQRRPPGGSTPIPNPAIHMSPVTLPALFQDSGSLKMEQAAHSSPSLHPPSIAHASRSPLHQYRPPLPPQAHIHQLQHQHQHLHQGYGRASSLEPGERELEGRGRMMDEKDIGHGGLGQLGIVRYAPVGKGYV
ncbi:Sds3-like-domain-containing protein [Tirmania nivea]|nr:Sds3-like-domain-containing protein [Tirmania nivea]